MSIEDDFLFILPYTDEVGLLFCVVVEDIEASTSTEEGIAIICHEFLKLIRGIVLLIDLVLPEA